MTEHATRSNVSGIEWHDADSDAWLAALRRLRHDCYHLPAYAAADALLVDGRPGAYIYEEAGDLLLVPLVLRRIPDSLRIDATSPYGYPGPIATTTDPRFWLRAVDSMMVALRAAGVVSCFVRLHPLLPAQLDALAGPGEVVRHGSTVSIDLRPPIEEVLAGFRANHRRQIARAARRGYQVTVDDWQHLDSFVDIYYETMRRVGAAPAYFLTREQFARLRTSLGDRIHLLLVRESPAAQILAGGLFFESCGIVQYHLGATRSIALADQPAKLMFAEACRWAQDRANDCLHLGAGVGGSNVDGLFQFKAGFSGRRHAFHTWRVIVDAESYRALTPPGDPAGYFPAYRSPPTNRGQDR